MESLRVLSDESANVWSVQPKPCFCVKFKQSKAASAKVFLNFCCCDELPPPADDITEDQLAALLSSDDAGSYRIPLSVGEPRVELDKSNNSCTAIDVIINRAFYSEKVVDSPLFRTFLVTVAIEAVQNKHKQIKLGVNDWIVLQNRKAVGNIQGQKIKKKPSKPFISEVKSLKDATTPTNSGVSEKTVVTSKTSDPFSLISKKVSSSGKWALIFECVLTNANCLDDVLVDVCDDRLSVTVKNNNQNFQIGLPTTVNETLVCANFDILTKKLRVTMPYLE